MKANTPTTKGKACFAATVAFLIALCLSLPVHAKDSSIEPDGFTGETSSAVSISHDDGEAAEATETSENAVVSVPAHDEARAQDSGGPTLSSFFYRLWSLFIFGG